MVPTDHSLTPLQAVLSLGSGGGRDTAAFWAAAVPAGSELVVATWGILVPHPGIEPGSPALQADSLPSEPLGKPLSRVGSVK